MEVAAYLVSVGSRPDLVNKSGIRASQLFEGKDQNILPPIKTAQEKEAARGVAIYEDTAAQIAALNSTSGSRKQWVDDSQSEVCQLCAVPFGWTRRKHHCRQCGVLCCYYCSTHTFQRRAIGPGSEKQPPGEILRCCDGCYNAMAAKAEQKAAAAAAAANAMAAVAKARQSAVAEAAPKPEKQAQAASGAAPSGAAPLPVAKPVDSRASLLSGGSGAAAGGANSKTADRHGTASSTAASLAQSKQALAERGEKLKRMEDKSANLAQAGANFADLAKKLREREENSWF